MPLLHIAIAQVVPTGVRAAPQRTEQTSLLKYLKLVRNQHDQPGKLIKVSRKFKRKENPCF